MLTLKEIGARIADQRKACRMTQVDVADKLGIPRSTFAQYETGVVDMPLSVALHVCAVLGMSPEVLVGSSGKHDAATRLEAVRRIADQLNEVLAGD